jgi:NodT family efflux transporter outer membrane factor (OMF) lipoprotein
MRLPFSPARRGLATYALVALALAGLTLSACASLPPAPVARVAKAPEAYETAQAFAAPTTPWPTDNWWERYNDPQLNALIAEALAGSPDLAQARARVLKAKAAQADASAALLPTLTGSGQVQAEKYSFKNIFPAEFLPPGYQDYGQTTLNLDWELDFWGKNRAAIAAAVSRSRAAAADLAEARLILTTDVASAYATLAQLYADRDVAAQSVKVREETAGLVAQRVNNGLDTQGDLKQAQAGAPATQADLAALDEQIALTRNQLAALLGKGPDRGLAIARPSLPAVAAFGLPAELPAHLIGRRPDVVAARWRAEAAVKDVTEAKARFYPDIDITGYVGQQSLHLSQLFAPGADFGAIGPAITLPIFDGGHLRAELRGAQADREAAVSAYDGAVTEAFRQVADAAASEHALAGRLKDSRLALERYEQAYNIARLRYEGGLSNYQSVLLVENSVLAERRIVTDLQCRALVLDIRLVRALGGGFGQS